MSQYPLLCVTCFLYLLLSFLTIATSLTLDCNFTPRDISLDSPSTHQYTCQSRCRKKSANPPDLRTVELDYRICSHPDLLTDSKFTIHRGKRSAEISLSRRKRELNLTPMWQSQPTSISVNQDSSIDLYCAMMSVSSDTTYEWFYSEVFPTNVGDTLSDPYNGVLGDTTGTLTIDSAGYQDAGFYQCKVTDRTLDGVHIIFSNIVEVNIENYYISEETMKFENIMGFNAEDVLILSCPEVDSNPPAEIRWYKDGTEYQNQGAFVYPFEDSQDFNYNSETYTITKNSLVLMSITSSDDGKYKCTASNEKTGQIIDLKEYTLKNYASSDEYLSKVKPTVLKESPMTVELGSDLTVYCLGIGHPTQMTYRWSKGDVQLDFNSRVLLGDHGRQVTIKGATFSDAGSYTCSCENERGSTSTYINVKVEEPKSVPDVTITQTPSSLYLHDVYSVSPVNIVIPCAATGARVRFLKNGKLLENTDRYAFRENVGLTFTSYSSQDSGVYQCVAFNAAHWKQAMTFVVITERVTAKASADVTLLDTDATLSCAVTGYPYPDIVWSKDGTQLTNTSPDSSPYLSDSSLVIRNIGFEDGGIYTCTASSAAPSASYRHVSTSNVTLTIGDLQEEYLARGAGTRLCNHWTVFILLALILSML